MQGRTEILEGDGMGMAYHAWTDGDSRRARRDGTALEVGQSPWFTAEDLPFAPVQMSGKRTWTNGTSWRIAAPSSVGRDQAHEK
jgi:hypothetical protein